MRVPRACLLGLLIAARLASAADPAAGPGAASPHEEVPVERLIADLSSDNFRTREDATLKLWAMGDKVLGELKATASGPDPEAAFRAAHLIQNIEHFITPETNPAVIQLVERYMSANRHDKGAIINDIRKLRGWHQILKLYSSETDPMVREELNPVAHFVGVVGAREKLLEGKDAEARRFLEMVPRDAQSLMSLAAFCRATGVLDAEIEKAKDGPADWRAALARAKGDTRQAAESARASEDALLAAAMDLFNGDALPWLNLQRTRTNNDPTRALYLEIMTGQWSGKEKEISPKAVAPLLRMVMESRDEDSRVAAANTLFLLGEPSLGEATLIKSSALDAAGYYSSFERISDALAALGMDPKSPDYHGWIEKRFEIYLDDKRFDNDRSEQDSANALEELVRLAQIMDQFGLYGEMTSAFEKPLMKLAATDEDTFISFLERLFAANPTRVAVTLGRNIGAKWAADKDDHWRTLVNSAFEEDELALQWWDWMPQLDPAASAAERFDGLLGLLQYSPDPENAGRRWLDLAWKAVAKAGPAQKTNLLKRIGFVAGNTHLAGVSGDAATALKVRDQLDPADRQDQLPVENEIGGLVYQLAWKGRWAEAAAIFRNALQQDTTNGRETSTCYLHSYLASALRRAGDEKGAAIHDAWADKLALGDWNICWWNSIGYAFGGDYERSAMWLARTALEAPPQQERYEELYLSQYAELLLEKGRWNEAAALAEAIALRASGMPLPASAAGGLLELRLKADLPRALSMLDTDRPRALALVARCHRLFPSGGLLADHFFPALRKAGLTKEHDEYFEKSWKVFADLIETYPKSHRLRNGAAWTAGRAARRLDEAERHSAEALKLNPDEAAYLDTMAEVMFAKKDRKDALRYSGQAVNFAPQERMIRRQYERFASDPFPGD